MDITTLTLAELKALAYDLLLQVQTDSNNLKIVENRINQLKNTEDGKEIN